jgi:hypothetical protein
LRGIFFRLIVRQVLESYSSGILQKIPAYTRIRCLAHFLDF